MKISYFLPCVLTSILAFFVFCGDAFGQCTASICGITNVSCNGTANGEACVSISGGTAPYNYVWSNGASTIGTAATFDFITGLSGGTGGDCLSGLCGDSVYTVTITDALGCVATASVTISEGAPLTGTVDSIKDVSCFGACDGIIYVTSCGGTCPSSSLYLWDDGSAQTTPIATGLCAGNYTVSITAFGSGCDTIYLNAAVADGTPTPVIDSVIASDFNGTNVDCYGNSTGTATVFVSSGVLPYAYSWNTTPSQDSITATGLAAGIYTVTVTDFNGCDTTADVTITEPPEIVITATVNLDTICVGMSAMINAFASGGTAGLAYIWAWDDTVVTGQGPFIVQPVTPTTYTVTVTDSLGCSKMDSVMVEVNPLIVTFTVPDSVCTGDSTTISVSMTGGDGNYSILWPSTGNTTEVIMVTPQVSTWYSVIVTDGCGTPAAFDSVFVEVNPYPVIVVTPVFASGCKPATMIFGDVVTDIPNSTYFWDFGDGTTSTAISPTHTYDSVGIFSVSLTVTSPKGCASTSVASATIIIEICSGVDENLQGFENLEGLRVYPNPTSSIITFDIELSEAGDIEIQIYNVLGELLYNKVLQKIKKTTYEVDMRRLTNGVYFVKMITSEGSINKRIVIAK